MADDKMKLSLSLLGSFRVTSDGVAIPGSRAKRIEALLAILVMEAAYPHRRERLVGFLFPELPDSQARTNLRQTIKRLRVAINDNPDQPHLLISRESVQFNQSSDYYLDTASYEDKLAGCSLHRGRREAQCPECLTLAAQAVKLYQGPFLDSFFLEDSVSFEEWLLGHRERLQREAIIALQQLADFHERRGEYDLAEQYAHQQITIEPWREEAHRQLMRLLAFQGRRAAALHQYDTLRDLLWEELAVEPMPESDALRRLVAASPEIRAQNLPARDRSFVGREEEIGQIRSYLVDADHRLLTLIGSGGSGKTALAVEAGWRASGEYLGPFMHGVFFVPLANVSGDYADGPGKLNPLVTAVAEALEFSFAGAQDASTQLFSYMRERVLLLILDNVEHLLEAGRNFVLALLAQTEGPEVLVTSRTRLNLTGEWILEVGGLPYPLEQDQPGSQGEDALALFVQRARRLVPEFKLATDDGDGQSGPCSRADVIRICQLLQGIPLGIELAASWVRFLSCREIATEIENSLDFLQSTSLDIPLRQQSLRAVFDYSWALLSQDEQSVLRCLSVFAGSFDHQAAAAVSRATLPQLASLVDHSLVRQKEGSAAGSRRFELLEVLRQYTTEKLLAASTTGERDVGDGHAAYYLGFVRDQLESLTGIKQQEALANINLEMPNIRKAWRWAAEYQEVTWLAQALDTMALFYYMNSLFAEGADNFGLAAEQLLKIRGDANNDLLWGRIRTQQGWLNFLHGRQQIGKVQLQEGLQTLRRYDSSRDLAFATGCLAVISYTLGNYEKANELATEGLSISEETEDAYSISVTSNILSQLKYRMGLYGPARQLGEQSLALARELESPWSIGFALINLGRVAYVTGEYKEAESLFEEAFAIRKAIGDARGLALCRLYLGDAAVAQGAWADGQDLWLDSLSFFEEIGNLEGVSTTLSRLGRVTAEQDRPEKAYDQYLEALRLADKVQATPRVLDALTGIASLLADSSLQKSLAIAQLVIAHPAATQVCRAEAYDLIDGQPALELNASQPTLFADEQETRLAELVADLLSEG